MGFTGALRWSWTKCRAETYKSFLILSTIRVCQKTIVDYWSSSADFTLISYVPTTVASSLCKGLAKPCQTLLGRALPATRPWGCHSISLRNHLIHNSTSLPYATSTRRTPNAKICCGCGTESVTPGLEVVSVPKYYILIHPRDMVWNPELFILYIIALFH